MLYSSSPRCLSQRASLLSCVTLFEVLFSGKTSSNISTRINSLNCTRFNAFSHTPCAFFFLFQIIHVHYSRNALSSTAGRSGPTHEWVNQYSLLATSAQFVFPCQFRQFSHYFKLSILLYRKMTPLVIVQWRFSERKIYNSRVLNHKLGMIKRGQKGMSRPEDQKQPSPTKTLIIQRPSTSRQDFPLVKIISVHWSLRWWILAFCNSKVVLILQCSGIFFHLLEY